MAPEKTGDSFAEEVEDRLENLFGEDDFEEESSDESADTADSPLRDLKAIVLSIDWEITDEVMLRFVEQIAELQDVFKDDKIVLVFLQLLGSIGEYIRVNLGKSHPDAFKILSSLYNNLDTVVHTQGMPDVERRKILSSELAKYKQLKGRLVPVATPAKAQKKQVEAEEAPAGAELLIPSQDSKPDVITALEEFKQSVQAELQALRKEIQQLKKTLSAKK